MKQNFDLCPSFQLIKDLNKLDLTCPVPGCGPHQKRHLLKECSFRLKETASKVQLFLIALCDKK